MDIQNNRITVVTPTLHRPKEVSGLIKNLVSQEIQPKEIILVDGAKEEVKNTENVVKGIDDPLPFKVRYIRHGGGTAIQRNVGIDCATGQYIALIDDDVRLSSGFFKKIITVFENDTDVKIGGIVGYRENKYFHPDSAQRWRWYRRLKLLSSYEPGSYDMKCGYPINAYMQKPFSGVREVDFMTTACAVWRKEVFDDGLRLDPFFRDFGVLEDAHFSLRAGKKWILLQSGDARCRELTSPHGRENRRKIGFKGVANYYYVFRDISYPLKLAQKIRFWRFQIFELFRVTLSALRRRRKTDMIEAFGRIEGMISVATGRYLK